MAAIPVNFVILVSLISIFLYLLGVHNFVTRVEENACEMTYMFEYPQYVEIPLEPDIKRKLPRYSLYGYNEGSGTEELRKMKFNGVPVLYIPGSGGSHRQGRSLASVALRKALNSRSPFHFDFFLVDFNEDLSGVYGGVLGDQTKFVAACIEKILSLYNRKSPYSPMSVVLIGHSAGGLVAKGVFTVPSFNPPSVQIIITLATPNAAPVIQPDCHLPDYYDSLSEVWFQRAQNVKHVTFISLGGGERDIVVRSDLTKDPAADINILTTAVPGVWCSMDHLSITWCKQLILTLVRTLFDCVDLETKQITTDQNHRRAVFEYHLINRSGGKKYGPHPVRGAFETDGRWVENLQRQFSVVEKKGAKMAQFVMLRLLRDPKHEAAFLEAVNLNVKDWVYACSADDIVDDCRVCDEGVNLSNLTKIMPAKLFRRKVIRLNMFQLKDLGFSHVIVRIPPGSAFVQVNVDIHQPLNRIINFPVPRVASLTSSVIIENTADNAVHYKVTLPGFDQIWQAFSIHLEAVTCRAATSHAVITFHVTWANETQHFFLVDQKETSVTLKLKSPRPKDDLNGVAGIDLILDPSCKYRLSIAPDQIGVASQIARYYSTLLPGYLVAVILMTLRHQMESADAGKGVPMFHNALAQSARKYYILLQAAIIGSKVLGSKLLARIFPMPDPVMLEEAGMDFFLLPILLFAVATALAYIGGAIIYTALIVSGQAAHKVAFRFLARTVTGVVLWSEWVLAAFHKLPYVVALIFVVLSISTTSGLAISLAACFYFLKLAKLYDDYLEELFKLSLKFVARTIQSVTRGKKRSERFSDSSPSRHSGNGEDDENENEDEENEQEREKGRETGEGSDMEDDMFVDAASEREARRGNYEAFAFRNHRQRISTDLTTLEFIHFHVTMCFLYFVTAATLVPSILLWSRSHHEITHLMLDPARWPGLVFCSAGVMLWQSDVPKNNLKLVGMSSTVLFVVAAFCIMFASISLHHLSFLSSIAIMYLEIHQIFARLLI